MVKYRPVCSSSAWDFLRGFQKNSFCDWPGKTSAVLFFGNCNLACPTCHNAQLAWHYKDLPLVNRADTLAWIAAKRSWLDGLVVTGGEPTILPELDQMLSNLAELELPIKMDSNGFCPSVCARVLKKKLVNSLAVDVKGPWEKYPGLTGGRVTSDQARDCLSEIFELAIKWPNQIIFRCTKVPGLTDQDIQTVRSYLPAESKLHLQKFIPPQKITTE